MPGIQQALHEAMRDILSTEPDRTATLQRLSEENARRDLYRQKKGDGQHPLPFQFKLRSLHHADFEFVAPDIIRMRT
jgi:hypothetical protein